MIDLRIRIIPAVSRLLILLAFLTVLSCGDYRPCKVLAMRICTDCPKVADHWQAACLCLEENTLKEKGYKCLDITGDDEILCNATLENWDENTCDLLN